MTAILLDAPNAFWDENIMNLIEGIGSKLSEGDFIKEAQTIAGIFSLLYLSAKAYAMILGEGKLEIMPLFRPFLLTLVIVNFPLFGQIVSSVGSDTQSTAETSFKANAMQMDNLLALKQLKTDSIIQIIEVNKQAIEGNLSSASNNAMGVASASVINVPAQLQKLTNSLSSSLLIDVDLMWARISLFFQSLITWIALSLMKGVMYCLFFIQMIFMHILLIIGPITFAFSILGIFRDAWVEWVKRYITISFWGTIAFIVMNIVCTIVWYGLKQEVDRLTYILNQGRDLINPSVATYQAVSQATATFFASLNHMDNFLGYLLIGLITAIGGIASTPLVASWIISGATGSAMRGMGAAAGAVAGYAAGAVSGGATAAVQGAAGATSAAMHSVSNVSNSSTGSRSGSTGNAVAMPPPLPPQQAPVS